jgi:hypothetical protein
MRITDGNAVQHVAGVCQRVCVCVCVRYEGRLCHTCSAGWARSSKADCMLCSWPMWANGLVVGAIVPVLSGAYAFMVRATPTMKQRMACRCCWS